MKLLWLTDIHLNFIDYDARLHFYQEIIKTGSDKILITGDIAEAPSLVDILKEMANDIKKPIYFVMGNHDYYRGQIDDVKSAVIHLTQKAKLLYWLPESGPEDLGNDIILLGVDGWADGRYGNFINSSVAINDSRMIVDFFQSKMLGKSHLLEKMQQLADKDAEQLHANLINTISKHRPKKIIVLTHVPPFKEACLYEGKISSDDFPMRQYDRQR